MLSRIVLLGVALSMMYTEISGLSTGLVVPGYLVLCLHAPERILYTLLLAAVSVLAVRGLSRFMILYGRRKFVMLLLICFILDQGVKLLGAPFYFTDAIGIIVPGLIAREFDRQGFRDTLISMVIVTGCLAVLLTAAGYGVF